MSSLRRDVVYALRTLRRAPLSTTAAIVALALGTGVMVAMFSVVHAVLLRPLGYAEPERIVTLAESHAEQRIGGTRVSAPNFFDWRNAASSFERLAGFYPWTTTVTGHGNPERVRTAFVSAGFFEILRVEPILGRTFSGDEDRPAGEKVVILSEGFRLSRFGPEAEVLERTLLLDDVPHTVIGVMAAGFDEPRDAEIWVPLGLDADSYPRQFRFLEVIGRLRDGAGLAAARSEMDTLAPRLAQTHPDANAGWGIRVLPLHEQRVGDARPALRLFLGACALVLAIAAVNVACLNLARTAARGTEFALRTALGASRRRLVRQGLTESVVLALLGGGAGLVLAHLAVRLLVRFGPSNLPRLAETRLDLTAYLFALGVVLLTGIACGLVPALRASKPDLARRLRTGGTAGRGGPRRLLESLVVAETGLALTLLFGAGLLIRSFAAQLDVDLGVESENVITMELELPAARYPEAHQPPAFFRDALERITALGGVEAAGGGFFLPLGSMTATTQLEIEGRPAPSEGEDRGALLWPVTPGFFDTLGIKVRGGRRFSWSDDLNAPPVVIVNEALAGRWWPSGDALGRRIVIEEDFGETGEVARVPREIVGIVEDVRHPLPHSEIRPAVYLPQAQTQWRLMKLAVRANLEPAALVDAVRHQIWEIDPDLAVGKIRAFDEILVGRRAQPRFSAFLLTALAAIALTLAAVGIFGVVSYSLSRRRSEIAVRMALGAGRERVLRQIVARFAMLSALGTAAGVAAAMLLTDFLATLLFGVAKTDMVTFAAAILILLGIGLVASYLPARRAVRLDPAHLLTADP